MENDSDHQTQESLLEVSKKNIPSGSVVLLPLHKGHFTECSKNQPKKIWAKRHATEMYI